MFRVNRSYHNTPVAFHTHSGVYDERVLAGLDWVIAQCGGRGLRLLLVLTNYWPQYGGLQQYVRWVVGG